MAHKSNENINHEPNEVGHQVSGMNPTTDSLHSIHFLSVEQFAAMLGVSPQTIDAWISSNYLKPGKHYFQHNRVVRVLWGAELLTYMQERTIAEKADRAMCIPGPETKCKPAARCSHPAFDPDMLN